jgi:hypothetical protein
MLTPFSALQTVSTQSLVPSCVQESGWEHCGEQPGLSMLGAGSSARYLQGAKLDSNSLTARSGWGTGSVGEEVQGSHEVQAWGVCG